MKRRRLPLVLLLLLTLTPPARGDLAGEVRAVLDDKLLSRATVAVKIVALERPGGVAELFAANADKPLIPASNMKLITTSAALNVLGPDFKFRTLLLQRGRDLVLIGDGDPSIGDASVLRKLGWTTTSVFENWARELKKAGFASFDHLIVDDSIFDEQFVHPRWPEDQLRASYCAQVAGLTLNGGCIEFQVSAPAGRAASFTTDPPTQYVSVTNTCVGGERNAVVLNRTDGANRIALGGTCPSGGSSIALITVHDPAMYAATVLAETFSANGVRIAGPVLRDRTLRLAIARDGEARLLAVHETALLQVITLTNKESKNPYAEALRKRSGAAVSGESGSWANGAVAAGAFLKRMGVPESEFHLDDGCGLSRENRVSADALVRVLQFNFASACRDDFLASLPVGGEDGTLDERFKGALRGRVFAKTGYISGVSALSGYLKARDGKWYAFSILMNGIPAGSNWRAKQIQEQIVAAIDRRVEAP